MDTTTVIIVVLFALIVVAAFLVFRQRTRVRINRDGLDLDASNDPPPLAAGVRAHDITSRKGGVVADDRTGRGVDAEKVDAQDDVLLSSTPPRPTDPKEPPPT